MWKEVRLVRMGCKGKTGRLENEMGGGQVG